MQRATGGSPSSLTVSGPAGPSHPAADEVNNTSQATTVHQLVTRLRATYEGLPVALVGHSLGSAVATREAATYKDVDAVVVTGLLHQGGAAAGLFGTLNRPAAEDPACRRRRFGEADRHRGRSLRLHGGAVRRALRQGRRRPGAVGRG
ncbi:alpha/beta fold hydrolase [Streptomyces sp. NPDC005820]|uniref:alpha/beta fold hydrolase n=1 Tax=Streptomyces sp. NPDC005820 TaxID=3157069 RepID=UPI0033F0182D